MSPKNFDAEDGSLQPEPIEPGTANKDLMKDAGVITMDESQSFGRGIISDFKRTVGTHWVEGMTNFNQKTVAVTLLLFISVIAPTLTFGAVYGKVTDNRIGTVETILATSWVGTAYSLIGGMPLVSTSEATPGIIFKKHSLTHCVSLVGFDSASSVLPGRSLLSRELWSASLTVLAFPSSP